MPGSPNGIAAGFFLAQHKRQLGGNKMIYKITVFKATHPITEDNLINLIFWVKDAALMDGFADRAGPGTDVYNRSRVVKKNADGRNIV